jgi:hypothetical protein
MSIQKWQILVSGIRHAAVHRLSQDCESLLHMTRAAIEFLYSNSGLAARATPYLVPMFHQEFEKLV